MKYKLKTHKLVLIDAFKWTGGPNQTEDPEWILEAIANGTVVIPNLSYCLERYCSLVMEINTQDGVVIARPGDYICRGVHGNIFTLNELVFLHNYEVDEPELTTFSDDLKADREKTMAMEEFEKLSKQFVDFLYKYGNPHSLITIDQTGANFLHGEFGISFELRD